MSSAARAEGWYAGIMSGTSLDAIDVVIARFSAAEPRITLRTCTESPFPDALRDRLTALIDAPQTVHLDELGQLHRTLGTTYSKALQQALTEAELTSADLTAVGCHGQTVRHQPDGTTGFSLQLGCAATLAAASGVAAVGDFRSADIALGGQGAPLVPAFHQFAFGAQDTPRVVVNIGGIANITVLQADGRISGYDTGPGNTLLDSACRRSQGQPYDSDGALAAAGTVDADLLNTLLQDPYFARTGPRSTGRERFNWRWLQQLLAAADKQGIAPADLQATLAELTAHSVAAAVQMETAAGDVFVCGGGAFNSDLLRRLQAQLTDPDRQIATTAALGLDPAWVEATAFAWLARARLLDLPGSVPAVTGARRAAVLGALHQP